ncbi:transglutaminase family protein [Devosia sp. A16]|uniref:transglutaminase family protein n=1 Tax=Devosia sp. A16 TaxID=1736675 RepID=UPI0006D86006|nr:transglutaminase family protein [Devosia sp. A16]
MKIAIRHSMSLALGAGVSRSVQHVLLTPVSGPTQTVREWSIQMPGIDRAASFADAFGNRAHLVNQLKPDPELQIAVAGIVETIDRNGVVGRVPGDIPPALYRRPTAATKPVAAITSKFRAAPRTGRDRIALLHALMARAAEVVSGGEQTQAQDGQNQSQTQSQAGAVHAPASDYAHGFIGAARALEIPARYVTGYLQSSDSEQSALHAWAEAWDDGLGWIGFDAMLQVCPTDRHVRVAVGLDATSTMPVRSIPVAGEPQVLTMSIEAAQ